MVPVGIHEEAERQVALSVKGLKSKEGTKIVVYGHGELWKVKQERRG